jgi:hypothetical protein
MPGRERYNPLAVPRQRSSQSDTRIPSTPPPSQSTKTGPADDDPQTLRAAAEENLKKTTATLRGFPVPDDVEPAFVFAP